MENTTKKKICVISLTFNRPWYIERSFDSLYSRAACKFDHYVFDDCSDFETILLLKKLQKKYHFKLFQNKKRLGIFKNFHTNVKNIPLKYDFYLKFDSDIEILSDNFIQNILEVVDMPVGVSVISPRIEGMFNSERLAALVQRVDFYNGHAIRNTAIAYGCCLFFSKQAFESFHILTQNELTATTEKFGIDSKLYEHALKYGASVIVEDLSAYHIDNTYGQRRRDMEYFIERNRWATVDKNEIWFLRVSKEIYPRHISRQTFDKIKELAIDEYSVFLNTCLDVLKNSIDNDKNNFIVESAIDRNFPDDNVKIDIYKVSAPSNFVRSKNLPRGTVAYFREIPDWVRSDPGVTVEIIKLTVADAKLLKVQ